MNAISGGDVGAVAACIAMLAAVLAAAFAVALAVAPMLMAVAMFVIVGGENVRKPIHNRVKSALVIFGGVISLQTATNKIRKALESCDSPRRYSSQRDFHSCL